MEEAGKSTGKGSQEEAAQHLASLLQTLATPLASGSVPDEGVAPALRGVLGYLETGELPVGARGELSFTQTSSEELAHRHKKELLQDAHRQRLELLAGGLAGSIAAIVTVACLVVVFTAQDIERVKLAQGVLTSVLAALLGFVTGKAMGGGAK